MNIRPYQTADESQVIQLWRDCGLVVPWNDPKKDIQRKLYVNPELFLVGVIQERVVATVMGGYDGHRGWINYLAVSPDHQGQHLGKQLIDKTEKNLLAMGCPKINLQIRSTNTKMIEYYKKLGFSEDNAVGMGKRLIQDD